MSKKNRKHSIIDGLPSDIKDAVDEMIKSNFTYHEIVEYIRKNGFKISKSSVQRYASNLNETLENLKMAQENFRAVMQETEKYKNLDVTDGILRLLSNQIFQAINSQKPDETKSMDFEKLLKNSIALTRAVAYKKKIDVDCNSALENGAEQFESLIFEAISDEKPELYKEIKQFIKEKNL